MPSITGNELDRRVRAALIMLTILPLLAFFPRARIAQEATDQDQNPVAALQQKLVDDLTADKRSLLEQCGLLKTDVNDEAEARRYIDCIIDRLVTGVATWGDRTKGILDEAKIEFQVFLIGRMPMGKSSAEQRRDLANATIFAHRHVGNWYRNTGILLQELAEADLLTQRYMGELLQKLQSSVSDKTNRAREFVGMLQADEEIAAGDLQTRMESFVEGLFSDLPDIVSAIEVDLRIERERILRQYPKDMDLRPQSFRDFVAIYDAIVIGSISALIDHARNQWSEPAPAEGVKQEK